MRPKRGWLTVAFLLILTTTPNAGTVEKFYIDEAHSKIGFSIGFMGLSTVEGSFTHYPGAVMYDPDDLTRLSGTVFIKTSSIFTGNESRDNHLRSPDFFDAAKESIITFQSKKVEKSGDGFQITGDLTMHGVTKEIQIPFKLLHGEMKDMWENRRIAFEGSVRLNRMDFGIVGNSAWNRTIDLNRLAIGQEVEVKLMISACIFNMARIGLRGSLEKPSVADTMSKLIVVKEIKDGIQLYHELKKSAPDSYNFGFDGLNTLGYRLLLEGKLKDAIEIFKLNVEVNPENANGYDSLAEGYAKKGDRELAVQNYKKSLALFPYNAGAIEMLKLLEKR